MFLSNGLLAHATFVAWRLVEPSWNRVYWFDKRMLSQPRGGSSWINSSLSMLQSVPCSSPRDDIAWPAKRAIGCCVWSSELSARCISGSWSLPMHPTIKPARDCIPWWSRSEVAIVEAMQSTAQVVIRLTMPWFMASGAILSLTRSARGMLGRWLASTRAMMKVRWYVDCQPAPRDVYPLQTVRGLCVDFECGCYGVIVAGLSVRRPLSSLRRRGAS
jgi:hypothetical protein